MSETIPISSKKESPSRWAWIPLVLFKPNRAFAWMANAPGNQWVMPLLLLSLVVLLRVAVAGPIKQQMTINDQTLPPDFEYYSPEAQRQFEQAAASTRSPVFIYVFPALTSIAGVWVGWLIVGGLLHLVLTLLGGRGDTGMAMNLVAWAGLPFAVRDLVRIGFMLSTHRLVQVPGLAGFAPIGESALTAYLTALLGLIDLYLIWHILLLMIGVKVTNELSLGKAFSAVVFIFLPVLLLQALLIHLGTSLSNLTIIRPFF